MTNMFRKATKKQSKLRLALIGLSGGGKTYTSLLLASKLADKVAVIDTERGSASKYSDIFDFDVLELDSFSPDSYIQGIRAAQQAGYEALVIDSLSHAWTGKGGVLEMHDKATMRSTSRNSYVAWRDVTPKHNELVDAILQANMHVFVTMRAKTEYVQEKDERTGKTAVRKVGLAPVQRDGLEYEFDVVADMDQDNNMVVSKTRCSALNGEVIKKPGEDVAMTLKQWLSDGEAVTERKSAKPECHCTENQIELIRKMYESHVITDKERESVERKYADGTLDGNKTIEYLKQIIADRKEVEEAQKQEA